MQHNLYIVALSVVVSVVYSFVALDFARRSNRKTNHSRRFWLFSASLTMGIGIWGTHFVGMMSLNMSLTAANHISAISQCMLIAVAPERTEPFILPSPFIKRAVSYFLFPSWGPVSLPFIISV
ncbi:hypothetical protein [Fictibacillus sp. NRS-1165]|uniref:hypothetical protein n=1 Tax=Fictibacillus sp. NRS-1165 TaxID=3144463 RepID=UPI003D1ADF9C